MRCVFLVDRNDQFFYSGNKFVFRLVGDALYGQTCGAAISCVSNYICSPTAVVCTCDTTTQFYNGSYCVQRYNYNDTCTQTLHCMTSLNLYCLS